MNDSQPADRSVQLKFLTPEQVNRIDDMLSQLGEYGEVRLIVQSGELRFINRVQSYKAWDTTRKK